MIVVQRRGGRVETEHPVAAVRVDANGRVLDRVGEPLVTTWRSAAKPFQLEVGLSLLPPGAVEALADEDLAIGASSHHAEPAHVARVQALLARFDLGSDALFCGAHPPCHGPSADALLREGGAPGVLHNNCSGKHTFMAATCRVQGWEPDYRDPSHPLQQRIRAGIEARTGTEVDAVVDGCGVPCWVLPLSGMGRAWAALARAVAEGDGTLGRIGSAMAQNPWLVGGTDSVDTRLVGHATAPLVAKVGAAGLLCVAVPEAREAVVIKVLTGDEGARAIAASALLQRWFPGVVDPAATASWQVVCNHVGLEVGDRRVR